MFRHPNYLEDLDKHFVETTSNSSAVRRRGHQSETGVSNIRMMIIGIK